MGIVGLYNPADVDEAHAEWSANCGPCALAAVLGRPVRDVRRYFPGFDRRRYVNPTQMREALALAGARWTEVTSTPDFGLAFLQIEGPWTKPGVPVKAAYRKTHWVGYAVPNRSAWVYDGNAREWAPRDWWEEEVMSLILDANAGATGWRVRWACEVELP